jgi:membrane protein required for colicin V production
MNWLDILLAVILAISTIMSARQGFSREIIGLAAAFFGLIFGYWFYGTAGSLATPYVSSERAANMIGFLLVFLGVWLLGSLFGWIVNRFLRTIGLSFFDRLLGAVFGLARGVLVAMALLTAFLAFGPLIETGTTPSAVLHSRIAPYVLEASRLFVSIAPMELKASFRKQYSQVMSAWRKTVPAERDLGYWISVCRKILTSFSTF